MTRIVALSDTHGRHEGLNVPDGDMVIHAGDITDDVGQASLRRFLDWFSKLPHKHKVFIAGNHDGAFEKWPENARLMVSQYPVTYLQEEAVEIEGIKLYGMPQTPAFCDWYFNVDRRGMAFHTGRIPRDTDILISHGPPSGILDVSGFDNQSCGCSALLEAVREIKPRYHVFGHIHHSYGQKTADGTCFLNCSICDEKYRPTRHPWVFDYEPIGTAA